MFDETTGPRVYYLPPGLDFPAETVAGISKRLDHAAPERWAHIHLVANSGRMLARLRSVFELGPARLLPRMSLVTDISALGGTAIEQTLSLRRQLNLARLIRPTEHLTNKSASLDLARSLAGLLDEMEEEGVSLQALDELDVGDQSTHWERALKILRIAAEYATEEGSRASVEQLLSSWRAAPPAHPIIGVGSTGSRGTTALLLGAISKLPQGAVILPGFDPHTPASVWQDLIDTRQEDHPQFRFAALMDALAIEPGDVKPWTDAPAPNEARTAALSLALRPAPVTHHWLRDGPDLSLAVATCDVTMVAAKDQRQEANAIALRLREAAEVGDRAALISPDRALTRRVSAALDRWGIVPDDSAGVPLSLTAPGRFLGQVAGIGVQSIAAAPLIALLKHPLVASSEADRGPHLLFTRALELKLRRRGPPFPTCEDIRTWANEDDTRAPWGAWLAAVLEAEPEPGFPAFLSWLGSTAEKLAAGPTGADEETGAGTGALWNEAAGRSAKAMLEDLETQAEPTDALTAAEAAAVLGQTMAAIPMNIQNVTHPNIMIWGTLDARAQGADLVILGGLNEGVWPQAPAPDPWLNRAMRAQSALRSPERQIGLSAHDFQQAAAAPEIWFTRATKSDDAETVPSRWLNRFVTLLEGLPAQGGRDALDAMSDRGQPWLDQANRLDAAQRRPAAKRPSPIPPISARPKRLSVTEIKTLIRDPYAIYARHVLRLRPLDPLVAEPDALLRGTVLHKVMEELLVAGLPDAPDAALVAVLEATDGVLNREVPWPAARMIWRARLMRVAPWFLETEAQRRGAGSFEGAELRGATLVDPLDFTLSGTADRIDLAKNGAALVYDYKTGAPPTAQEQKFFDKQLLLEAEMIERGGFERIGPRPVARAAYIGLGTSPREADAPLGETDVWSEFKELITHMMAPRHGFTARRAMQSDADRSEYDLLARYGEWAASDTPEDIDL